MMKSNKKMFEVFIVDDNKFNLQLLDDILTQQNYKVRTAETGEIALAEINAKLPDLILLDIVMPDMDGYEVCERLKSDPKTAPIPIIFISGNYELEDKIKAFEIGGIDYITKPFYNEEVLARVDTHIQLSDYKHHLEKRVDEEVKKNIQVNNLMMHQSRLAQMGEMISMITHQWRQPLSAISATSMNMKIQMQLGENTEEASTKKLEKIESLVEYLSQTIEDFRGFFRMDKEKETKNIVHVVEKSLSIISSSLKNNNIEVVLDGSNECKITTYTNELMQVILIILKNAEDALIEREIEKPKISISWKEENGFYVISFHDNAGGIDEETLPNIFNPYFSTKAHENGTGLGLYMATVIIDEHCKGEVDVQNEDDGVTFTIKLPLSI